jgi:hypothetical protein
MKLNHSQKRELIKASKIGIDNIETTIRKLKEECPDAFHNDNTLLKRRFHHRPNKETPCYGFVIDRPSTTVS